MLILYGLGVLVQSLMVLGNLYWSFRYLCFPPRDDRRQERSDRWPLISDPFGQAVLTVFATFGLFAASIMAHPASQTDDEELWLPLDQLYNVPAWMWWVLGAALIYFAADIVLLGLVTLARRGDQGNKVWSALPNILATAGCFFGVITTIIWTSAACTRGWIDLC